MFAQIIQMKIAYSQHNSKCFAVLQVHENCLYKYLNLSADKHRKHSDHSFKCNNMLHFHPNAFFSQFSFSDWQISENAIWHCSIYGQWKSFFHLFHQESLCLSQSSLHFLHIQSEQCPLLLELFMRFRQVPHGVLHFLEANRDWQYPHWTHSRSCHILVVLERHTQ